MVERNVKNTCQEYTQDLAEMQKRISKNLLID